MTSLPANDLRSNVGTWAVPERLLPAVGLQMVRALPAEAFDPGFAGQELVTTYFDTRDFRLRKARVKKGRYLTVRVRCYGADEAYALSAKTETQKFRRALDPALAELLLQGGMPGPALAELLPGDLVARAMELAGDTPLEAVVAVAFRRYAVEDTVHRLTLDCRIVTDTGKRFPMNVLEMKSTQADTGLPVPQPLRPMKMSKFLWATG